MKNFKNEIESIKRIKCEYMSIPNESNDDNYFAEKYGEIGINSRKDFFIWKDNISSMASNKEIKELESKYKINF